MAGKPNQTGQPGGSSSIEKPEATNTSSTSAAEGAGKTNDLSGQTKDPNAVGFGGNQADQRGTSGGTNSGVNIDADDVIGGLTQGFNSAMGALPGVMQAIPALMGGAGGLSSGLSGIGSSVSGLANGLGSILGSDRSANLGGAGQEFRSGQENKLWIGSSECYVDDHERERFVDVTDLDEDPMIQYVDKKPKQGPKKTALSENANPNGSTLTSGDGINDTGVVNLDQVYKAGASEKPWDGHRVKDFAKFVRQNGQDRPNHQLLQEYLKKPHRKLDQGGQQHLQDFTAYSEQHQASVSGDSSDIVAEFHRTGGIQAINSGGGGGYSDEAIFEQARGFLRTAGRNYSLSEQRELEQEFHPRGARNLKDLDLNGTHYEDGVL
jgi:hypothetical protein